jgi:hypothetical protein
MQNELTPTPGMSFSALRPGGRVSFSAVALEDCVLETYARREALVRLTVRCGREWRLLARRSQPCLRLASTMAQIILLLAFAIGPAGGIGTRSIETRAFRSINVIPMGNVGFAALMLGSLVDRDLGFCRGGPRRALGCCPGSHDSSARDVLFRGKVGLLPNF